VAWYYDEIDETPLKVLKKAHSAGLIKGDIPKKYGGKGWGLVEEECPYCFFPESAFKKAS